MSIAAPAQTIPLRAVNGWLMRESPTMKKKIVAMDDMTRTAAAVSAVAVENRYIATITRPCRGKNPRTVRDGNSAAMMSV